MSARRTAALFSAILTLSGTALLPSCGRPAGPDRLTMELLPEPGNPLVAFRVLVKVGTAEDPTGKDGLCRLAWSLVAEGVDRAFFPMAASVSLDLDKEMSAFSITVPRDNLPAFYPIIRDGLLHPGFRTEDFERLKAAQAAFLEETPVDEAFGREILGLMIYDGHPYGRSDAGTVETVGGLTLDEVRAFYREHFVRGNITVGLAGGYPESFPEEVRKDFEKLPAGFTPRLALPPARAPQGLDFVLVEKDTPGTTVVLGFPVPVTRADRDFFALRVAAAGFGDTAAVEHFVEGRDGLPAPGHARRQQYFSAWVRPRPGQDRVFAIRRALLELRRLAEEGLSEERFETVRTRLLDRTRLSAPTLDGRLGRRMDSVFYGREDFPADAAAVLPRLTRDDVNAAARKYLRADDVRVAVVTADAGDLKEELVSGRPSPVPFADPGVPVAVLEEDAVIRTYRLGVRPENVRVVEAGEFLRRPGIPAGR